MSQSEPYVTLRGGPAGRAADLRRECPGGRRIQGSIWRGGKTRIPLRCYADVQNESIWCWELDRTGQEVEWAHGLNTLESSPAEDNSLSWKCCCGLASFCLETVENRISTWFPATACQSILYWAGVRSIKNLRSTGIGAMTWVSASGLPLVS